MNFIRDNTILEKVLVIDGLSGCGKVVIDNFLSLYPKIEILNLSPSFENTTIFNYFDKFSDDAFDNYIKILLDYTIYENTISRNVNFKPFDQSSVFKSYKLIEYVKRLFKSDTIHIPNLIKKEKPFLRIMTASILGESQKLFEILKDKLFFIEVVRNPYLIVKANMNFINNFEKGDGRYFNPTIINKNIITPYWAFDIADNYNEMSIADKAIYLIMYKTKLNNKFLSNKKDYQKHLRIYFDDFIKNPSISLTRINNFLNIKYKFNNKLYKKYKLPRDDDFNDSKKNDIINYLKEANVKSEYLNILENLSIDFINNKK